MDVGSSNEYPYGALSNFTAHSFIFDGVECASMEGLLQSFKFDKPNTQIVICSLVGFRAKRQGKTCDKYWKSVQKLWWKGITFEREGSEYQELLDRAFDALSENKDFQKALLATGDVNLTHSIGNPNKWDTCLTEDEFCSRLMKIRDRLQ